MSVVDCVIKSAGEPIGAKFRLLSVDIQCEVNRVPAAELRFIDGSAAKQVFESSDTPSFEPGKLIEIALNYVDQKGNVEDVVFEGIVVRHGVEVTPSGSTLVVGLKDRAVKLTGARHNAVYANMTESQIFEQVIQSAGVLLGEIAKDTPLQEEMVCYDATPWDFLSLRAEALGLLVTVDRGAVSITPMLPAGGEAAKHTFNYGIDSVFDLDIQADAEHPYQAVEGAGWDPKTNALTNPSVQAKAAPVLPGNLDPMKLAEAVGREKCSLVHAVPAAEKELPAWVDARLARSRLATLRGRIAVKGRSGVKLLDTIEIKGVGARFNGLTRVTGIRHRYDSAGWRMDVQFGLSPERLCQRDDIADSPARGLLPPARGLRIGVVAAFKDDPGQMLRVQVVLPGVGVEPSSAVWARLASPDAGMGRGVFFRPELDDEVIVGFLNDDPRHPIILGSLYSQKNAAPVALAPPSAVNDKKGIVTKKGTTIAFIDGEKPSVYIETMSKNRIVIDDAAGGIAMTDQNGNKITLDAAGITLDAGAGNVTIKGAKVDVS